MQFRKEIQVKLENQVPEQYMQNLMPPLVFLKLTLKAKESKFSGVAAFKTKTHVYFEVFLQGTEPLYKENLLPTHFVQNNPLGI